MEKKKVGRPRKSKLKEAPVEDTPVTYTIGLSATGPYAAVNVTPALRLERGDVVEVTEQTLGDVARAFKMKALPPILRDHIIIKKV